MEKNKILLNEEEISIEELEEIKKDPNIRLKKISENVYKSKVRLLG